MRKLLYFAVILPLVFISCDNKDKNVDVTSVVLNQTFATLLIEDTLMLTATVLPSDATNKNVSWSSDNTIVATVNNNGGVTAIFFGFATITVTTDNHKTAVCTIIVNSGDIFLGDASFVTDSTWTISNGTITQTWSDAVQTANCSNKTTFNGGIIDGNVENWVFNIDCRSNPGQKGDLFSWRAVAEHQDLLCPNGWRVPTRQDFRDLDIAFGGDGVLQINETHRDKYLNVWGGNYGGFCHWEGTLRYQGMAGYYWSQSEFNTFSGINMSFNINGHVSVQAAIAKSGGYTLRCVRNK
jgi:uncharacterized protein (TIGR02145 family)